MTLLDQIAEQTILAAVERGDLDDLPGDGKPLKLDDDSMVPESLRAGYRLLKNSGFLPPELQLRSEIQSVEQLLVACDEGPKSRRLGHRLALLRMQLEASGAGRSLMSAGYEQRLAGRLG